MDRQKNISIGEDSWIEWKDFDVHSVQPYRIDAYMEPTAEFWKGLETECVAACCGIGAFAFWPEDIERAAKNAYSDSLTADLITLKLTLDAKTESVITSSLLNQLLSREVFIELLEHIIKNINKQHITTE